MGALFGAWATNYYRDKKESDAEKTELRSLLNSILVELGTFSVTVNAKKNQASEMHELEKSGSFRASDAHVTTLKIYLPPLMSQVLSNTKLDSKLIGNIQNLQQIIDRNNSLIEGVIIERSKEEICYEDPLGDIALNYFSISTLLGSIKKQLNEEITKYT